MRTLTATLTLALTLAACSPAPQQAPAVLGLTAADDAGRHTIRGNALAPVGVVPRLITNDGGSMVAQGAGNLITNDGGSRHVQAAGERPLAGARVWLTDAAGRPLDGTSQVTTAVDGSFTVSGVPITARGLVRVEAALADGRPTWLECPLDPAVTPRVDLASTLAIAALRTNGGLAGPLNTAAYTSAVATFEEAPPAGAVAALADPAALGQLAAGIAVLPADTPPRVGGEGAPARVAGVVAPPAGPEAASSEAGPQAAAGPDASPSPGLICRRMQPKLGAPPTTICAPWSP